MPKKKYWWIEDDEQNELLARKFKVNNFLNDDAYTNLADNYKEDAKIWQMFKIYKNHLMAMYEKVVPLFLTLHVGDKKVTKFADLNNFNYSPLSAQQRKQTLEEVKSLADSVRQLERNFNAVFTSEGKEAPGQFMLKHKVLCDLQSFSNRVWLLYGMVSGQLTVMTKERFSNYDFENNTRHYAKLYLHLIRGKELLGGCERNTVIDISNNKTMFTPAEIKPQNEFENIINQLEDSAFDFYDYETAISKLDSRNSVNHSHYKQLFEKYFINKCRPDFKEFNAWASFLKGGLTRQELLNDEGWLEKLESFLSDKNKFDKVRSETEALCWHFRGLNKEYPNDEFVKEVLQFLKDCESSFANALELLLAFIAKKDIVFMQMKERNMKMNKDDYFMAYSAYKTKHGEDVENNDALLEPFKHAASKIKFIVELIENATKTNDSIKQTNYYESYSGNLMFLIN